MALFLAYLSLRSLRWTSSRASFCDWERARSPSRCMRMSIRKLASEGSRFAQYCMGKAVLSSFICYLLIIILENHNPEINYNLSIMSDFFRPEWYMSVLSGRFSYRNLGLTLKMPPMMSPRVGLISSYFHSYNPLDSLLALIYATSPYFLSITKAFPQTEYFLLP